jgi:hypothetical protein
MPKRLTVYVDDNSHYMDESERYMLGEFENRDAAVTACKRIVDEDLARWASGRTAEELFELYVKFGEDPWIAGDDADRDFSARDYARTRCHEIAKKE